MPEADLGRQRAGRSAKHPEARQVTIGTTSSRLKTLRRLVANSPIVVVGLRGPLRAAQHPLPHGYSAVDIAILEWIVAEAGRARGGLARA